MQVPVKHTMKTRLPYDYSPLPQGSIRLLYLEPNGYGDLATLRVAHFDNLPRYFALSYAWAAEPRKVPIQVDRRVLYIGPSLAAALQQLQNIATKNLVCDGLVSWLWIDSLCINQEDVLERSHQVQVMGLIYSRAVRTLIWLGPTSDLEPAFVLIDQIYDVFREENPRARFLAEIPLRLYSDRRHATLCLPAWHDELWEHLTRLSQLPWFSRTWVIQEVTLSRADPVVFYGSHRYPWDRLAWAASWLRRNGYLRLAQVPSQMQNVDTMSNIRRSRSRWHLDALLLATSVKCHASNPRDKVYSLLGLAIEALGPSCVPRELYPDYELDVVQVYARVSRFLFEKSKVLAILTRASGVPGSAIHTRQRKLMLEHLPSWVPDWSDFTVAKREVVKSLSWVEHPSSVGTATLGFPKHYNASTDFPQSYSILLIRCYSESLASGSIRS